MSEIQSKETISKFVTKHYFIHKDIAIILALSPATLKVRKAWKAIFQALETTANKMKLSYKLYEK